MTFTGLDLDGSSRSPFPGAPMTTSCGSSCCLRLKATTTPVTLKLLYLKTLEHLSRERRALVVLVPRYARQAADLEAFAFANPPVVLDRPVPFVSLLKAVDLVLCSGGTMLA